MCRTSAISATAPAVRSSRTTRGRYSRSGAARGQGDWDAEHQPADDSREHGRAPLPSPQETWDGREGDGDPAGEHHEPATQPRPLRRAAEGELPGGGRDTVNQRRVADPR